MRRKSHKGPQLYCQGCYDSPAHVGRPCIMHIVNCKPNKGVNSTIATSQKPCYTYRANTSQRVSTTKVDTYTPNSVHTRLQRLRLRQQHESSTQTISSDDNLLQWYIASLHSNRRLRFACPWDKFFSPSIRNRTKVQSLLPAMLLVGAQYNDHGATQTNTSQVQAHAFPDGILQCKFHTNGLVHNNRIAHAA